MRYVLICILSFGIGYLYSLNITESKLGMSISEAKSLIKSKKNLEKWGY